MNIQQIISYYTLILWVHLSPWLHWLPPCVESWSSSKLIPLSSSQLCYPMHSSNATNWRWSKTGSPIFFRVLQKSSSMLMLGKITIIFWLKRLNECCRVYRDFITTTVGLEFSPSALCDQTDCYLTLSCAALGNTVPEWLKNLYFISTS